MAIIVTTAGPVNKHSVNVTLGGSYTGTFQSIYNRWFYWYTINQINPTPATSTEYVGSGNVNPFTKIKQLIPGNIYYYRAVVVYYERNTAYTAYGQRVEFQMGFAVTANATGASNIEGSNARLNGSFTRDDERINTIQFQYWRLQTPGTIITITLCNLPNSPPNYCSLYGPSFYYDLHNLVQEVWYGYRVRVSISGHADVFSNVSTFYTGLLELNFRAYADTPTGRVYGQNMIIPL